MKIRNKKSNTLLNLVSYELKDQIVIEPWPTRSDENPEIFLGFGHTGETPGRLGNGYEEIDISWQTKKWQLPFVVSCNLRTPSKQGYAMVQRLHTILNLGYFWTKKFEFKTSGMGTYWSGCISCVHVDIMSQLHD